MPAAFLFPAAGLVIASVILFWIVHRRIGARAVLVVCGALVLPAAVISGAIAGVPLMHATRSQFYFGASTLNSMISSLVRVSFLLRGLAVRHVDKDVRRPSPGFDYYVLAAEDRQFLTRFRLRPILTDAFGSVLAVPDGAP